MKSLIVWICTTAFLVGCTARQESATPKPPSSTKQVSAPKLPTQGPSVSVTPAVQTSVSGKVESRRYVNDYFGFSVTIPGDWELKTEGLNEYFAAKGREHLEKQADEMERARPQIEYILKANRRSAEAEGAPFLQLAISIHRDGAIRTGQPTPHEYIKKLLKDLETGAEEVKIIEPPRNVLVQGQEFEVASYFLKTRSIAIYQRAYVRYVNNDVLSMVASYATDDHVKVLKELIQEQSPDR